MWMKTLQPASRTATSRPAAMPRPVVTPAKPVRVLQSSRVPQQLSFEFRRG